jgi:hypothetical protein
MQPRPAAPLQHSPVKHAAARAVGTMCYTERAAIVFTAFVLHGRVAQLAEQLTLNQ